MSRLKGRALTWLYLCLWGLILVVWAWSTGWRTYFIKEDLPILLFMSLFLIFVAWLDEKQRGL